MKKLLFATLLLCAVSFSAEAQLVRFGVKGGVNFSNFNGGVDGIDYSGRTGWHAGALVEIGVTENFKIQPEALFSSQGADVDGVGDFNLDYVSVPVLAKFYIVTDKLSLDFGPQFSFLVNESEEAFDDVLDGGSNNSFDFALAGGLGLDITDSFFAQARYTIGLTEVSKDADVKNAVFQVSLGYKF
ncbi:outer membrane beta-barrel protein [Flavobacterium sp. NST-5]|uniref:Outer membrane beta-barrel protein n=1 Tax=Flavobacterium ichthyis TaxID=2698827 RepID=A0ABW9Z8P4_9FLAO|nr:porin family protein [Flavobacterium ichthyis]NBL64475.1 outer membrane beta-barrel protein [Flavobacterium ichthyis]